MNCSDNKWKEIWEKRTENLVAVDRKNPIDVFVELKRIDGFDVIGGGYSAGGLDTTAQCYKEATEWL